MWNEVEEFISPEKALKSISLVSEQFEESENPSSVVDFQTHPLPGKTVEEYGWFHNVRTITEERKPSESADTTSTIEAIDKGPPEQLVDTKYSGIVEQKKWIVQSVVGMAGHVTSVMELGQLTVQVVVVPE